MNTEIRKEFDIKQPMDVVWKSLANPEDIVTCVPGAQITEKIDDKNYKGGVITKFGPVKVTYNGEIHIEELDEANKKMVLKGKGLDSKGKGSADMEMTGLLSEIDGGTHVDFTMNITIIGMLAQFGSRLIQDVSDQLLNQFVSNFQNKLDSENPPMDTAAGVVDAVSDAIENAAESAASTVSNTAKAATEKVATATKSAPDNSLNAFSLIGTVIKSIFRSIFGGGK